MKFLHLEKQVNMDLSSLEKTTLYIFFTITEAEVLLISMLNLLLICCRLSQLSVLLLYIVIEQISN